MENFRTYDLAINFYHAAKAVQLPGFLKTQLLRAASSVSLNLGEGNHKSTRAERRRYFGIAFASVRECQTVVKLEPLACRSIQPKLEVLAASLYRLLHSLA